MRPQRAIVKKAIQDAGGNLTRAAALLGCTRQSLYTWIYQLGLERLAGIRMDNHVGIDKRSRMDSTSNSTRESGVKLADENKPIFRVVETQETADPIIPATIKVRESLWKRLKIAAIEEDTTMGAIVEKALEKVLGPRRLRRVGKSEE